MKVIIENRKRAPHGKQWVLTHPDGTESHHETMSAAHEAHKAMMGGSEEGEPVADDEGAEIDALDAHAPLTFGKGPKGGDVGRRDERAAKTAKKR